MNIGTDKNRKIFMNRLAEIMHEQHLTEEELAEKINRHKTTVWSTLHGGTPNFSTLISISVALGVSLDYLVGLSDRR